MKIKPDDQAFTTSFQDPNTSQVIVISGLTKREYFIAAALQGLCAQVDSEAISGMGMRVVAETALFIADKTIEAINVRQ